MDLANMRRNGVRNLIAYCLNDACRHQALIDVSSYPADTPVPWFGGKVVCAKCGARGRHIDVRPNWKEKPGLDRAAGRRVNQIKMNGPTTRQRRYIATVKTALTYPS
jgi:hypothetical protein